MIPIPLLKRQREALDEWLRHNRVPTVRSAHFIEFRRPVGAVTTRAFLADLRTK